VLVANKASWVLGTALIAIGTTVAADSLAQAPGLTEVSPTEPHFAPLPGLAVGVLVSNVDLVLRAEGRFGPAGAAVFSRDDTSYRWFYVSAVAGETGETVNMPVGEAGDRTQRFKDVVLATTSVLRARAIPERFVLAEAEVNGGLGSPPVESFVATKLRVLDRTPEYPIDTARTVDAAVVRCRDRLANMDAAMEQALASATRRETPGADEGTHQETLTTRVTWLSGRERLRIECHFRVTKGEYRYGQGVARQGDQAVGDGLRYGRQVGVTVTLAFEAGKAGQIEPAGETSPQPFILDLPPPGETLRAPQIPRPSQ
jgi:hypothetical protein